MFCYECGKKLVPGAKFCMNCGANVEAYIGDDAFVSAQTEQNAGETEDIMAASTPQTEAEVSEPEPASEAASQAVPPEPVPEEPVQEEPKLLDVYMTDQELRSGETVIVSDPSLLSPMRIRIPAEAVDGTRMRMRNVRVRGENGVTERTVIVTLHVVHPQEPQTAPEPEPVQPTPPVQQAPPLQQTPPVQPTPPVQQEPPVQQTPIQQAAPRQAAPHSPVNCKCFYQLCLPSEFRTFKFGGADNEGYVTIESDRIVLTKKSKAVGLTFGLVGSLIEGKGKEFAAITRDQVVSFEKNLSNKGKLGFYLINLTDGRALRIAPGMMAAEDMERAMDAFLA